MSSSSKSSILGSEADCEVKASDKVIELLRTTGSTTPSGLCLLHIDQNIYAHVFFPSFLPPLLHKPFSNYSFGLLHAKPLSSTILYSALLHSTLLYSTLLLSYPPHYYFNLHSSTLLSAIFYSTLLYSTLILSYPPHYSFNLHSSTLLSSIFYSTILILSSCFRVVASPSTRQPGLDKHLLSGIWWNWEST